MKATTLDKAIIKTGREKAIDILTKVSMYGTAVKYCLENDLYLNTEFNITKENLDAIYNALRVINIGKTSLEKLTDIINSQVYSLDMLVSIVSPYFKEDFASLCKAKAKITEWVNAVIELYGNNPVVDLRCSYTKDDNSILSYIEYAFGNYRYILVVPNGEGYKVKELNKKEYSQICNSFYGDYRCCSMLGDDRLVIEPIYNWDIELIIDLNTLTCEIEPAEEEEEDTEMTNTNTNKMKENETIERNENMEENEMEKTKTKTIEVNETEYLTIMGLRTLLKSDDNAVWYYADSLYQIINTLNLYLEHKPKLNEEQNDYIDTLIDELLDKRTEVDEKIYDTLFPEN